MGCRRGAIPLAIAPVLMAVPVVAPADYERVEDAVCLSQEDAMARVLALYTPDRPVEVREEPCAETTYRVRIMGVGDLQAARDIRREVDLAGFPAWVVPQPEPQGGYAVQVGAFDERDRAETHRRRAEAAGLGPFTIEEETVEETGYTVYRRIETAAPESEAGQQGLVFRDSDADPAPTPEVRPEETAFDAGFRRLRAESGLLMASGRPASSAHYLHGRFALDWQPGGDWEGHFSGRFDGYLQSGDQSLGQGSVDYGESWFRYRGEDTRLTLGAQEVIWGRVDEIPPQDRLSALDLNRYILDDLSDRRRATPGIRLEQFGPEFTLDLLWMPRFREAELPDNDSIWYPVDQRQGRVAGLEHDDVLAGLVRHGSIEDGIDGDPVGGMRITRMGQALDFGLTLQRTRHGAPYYELHPEVRAALAAGQPPEDAVTATEEPTFTARHPRTWAAGGDLGFEAGGVTWRAEAVWMTDVPATTTDLEMVMVEGAEWVAGAEFYPGDADLRVNIQLAGEHLLDAPEVLDREDHYAVTGEVEETFAHAAWRARLRFSLGLNADDIYLNPRIAYERWAPHELYAAFHYFEGEDGTLGHFYRDNRLLTAGWQVRW